MNPVESFIFERSEKEREILSFFHDLFVNTYDLKGALKWKVPTYFGVTWTFYLNPDKKGGIHLCFMRGRELSNIGGILKSEGRKMVTSFNIKNLENIPYELLIQNIEEAILLDQTVPFKVQKKK